MFLPLHDKNPLRVIPFQIVTVSFIAINVCIFLFQWLLPEQAAEVQLLQTFGMVPGQLWGGAGTEGAGWNLPEPLTLITYAFFHADWWHLLGNMLFLWVFGDNVEDAMGHRRFLIFALLCAAAAGLSQALVNADLNIPVIGASGLVAGVMGAYLVLHPRVRILVLAFNIYPLHLPSQLLLVLWFLMQLLFAAVDPSPVAWWAHIGGFVAGAVLVTLMKRPEVPLFDRGVPH